MLLQLAIDKPESMGVISLVADLVDIVEVGTPVLKRLGLNAITAARKLALDTAVLADTKTVDAGATEAEMVFAAGAKLCTVLSNADRATHVAAAAVAEKFDAYLVADTIVDSDIAHLSARLPDREAYVSVHIPTDARLYGEVDLEQYVRRVREVRDLGYQISLAGGMGPDRLDFAISADPDILVVGSAITEADDPRKVTQWMRDRMPATGHGWPSSRR
ncbi:MAG: 3-hexulose-6-phosphate synthase [Actinomycetota bacterium]|jgi:3-hexulose-6-phosphate synthase|nr:3-hexulose-6-phosphate synthase [Actinomycetota bacterium]MDQ1664197.1 3-hexulose-6-phosphate synthase [Actinomycetota bacterium]MDQ1669435.1 3-hexulose-6-phosphate synthase [Actinomycetota bacterium]